MPSTNRAWNSMTCTATTNVQHGSMASPVCGPCSHAFAADGKVNRSVREIERFLGSKKKRLCINTCRHLFVYMNLADMNSAFYPLHQIPSISFYIPDISYIWNRTISIVKHRIAQSNIIHVSIFLFAALVCHNGIPLSNRTNQMEFNVSILWKIYSYKQVGRYIVYIDGVSGHSQSICMYHGPTWSSRAKKL